MMNTEQQSEILTNTPAVDSAPAADPAAADMAANAETRLQLKREAMRLRLAQQQDDPLGQIGVIARMAAPLARQMVRQYPYAALTGAALIGVLLVRGKPWRALGSSVFAGLMARQMLSYSLSSGSRLFKHLLSRDRAGSAPDRSL